MTDGERLLRLALERGALRYGDFTLSSGQKSKYYFDGRLLSLDPEGAYLIGKAILPILNEAGAQAIGGPTLGADPIVAAVALTSHLNDSSIPAFIVRKDAKSHGTGQLVEGPLAPGSRVAIVDDTCTTGASLFHAIEAAEAAACTVVKVVAILDRHQGGSEELKRRGFDFTSLLASTPEGEVRVVQSESVDAPSRSSRFWNPPTIEELAFEQGVHPVKDLEQVFGGWPEDADFESFLKAIRRSRTE
ncbi:MAG: orotate phosphoribosyltransferase [Dehalococcoidia bacterium]|nr:orotate phosphoribosyltransferase [Dehalococcoidia bacterium]